MALLYNLAKMTTATTGTGTITLGSAVPGFLSFAGAGVTDGQVVSYAIQDGSNGEIGTGTYTSSGTTLTRSVTNSTNSNSAINLSGNAIVYITPRSADLLNPTLTSAQTLSGPLITTASTTSAAGLNLPQGSAPTSPTNGDLWTTSAGVYARINGTTVGPFSGGSTWTQIATTSSPSGTTVDFTSIPGTYQALFLMINGLAVNAASGIALSISINNGSSWSTQLNISPNDADAKYGAVFIPRYAYSGIILTTSGPAASDGDTSASAISQIRYRASTPINALRIICGSSTFSSGTLTLYGM